MKLHPLKKIGIVVWLPICLCAVIIMPRLAIGTFDSTRAELNKFYESEIENCTIISTIEKKYPGAGYYNLFQVNCYEFFFPILLVDMTIEDISRFQNGVQVLKKKNTHYFKLFTEDETINMEMRRAESEKDGYFLILILTIVWSVIIIALLIALPNKFFEQNKKRWSGFIRRTTKYI